MAWGRGDPNRPGDDFLSSLKNIPCNQPEENSQKLHRGFPEDLRIHSNLVYSLVFNNPE